MINQSAAIATQLKTALQAVLIANGYTYNLGQNVYDGFLAHAIQNDAALPLVAIESLERDALNESAVGYFDFDERYELKIVVQSGVGDTAALRDLRFDVIRAITSATALQNLITGFNIGPSRTELNEDGSKHAVFSQQITFRYREVYT